MIYKKHFITVCAVIGVMFWNCTHRDQPRSELVLGDTVPAKEFEPKDSPHLSDADTSAMNKAGLYILLNDAATTMQLRSVITGADTVAEKDQAIQIHGNPHPGDTVRIVFLSMPNEQRAILNVQKYTAKVL